MLFILYAPQNGTLYSITRLYQLWVDEILLLKERG